MLKLIKTEKKFGIHNIDSLRRFANNCKKNKKIFYDKIINLKNNNHKIYGFGATSKSTTILNYCNINNDHIETIFDNSKTKIKKFTPLTNVPITSSEYFNKTEIKYCILFAWNHYKEIFSKIKKSNKIRWISHIDKKYFKKYNKYFL